MRKTPRIRAFLLFARVRGNKKMDTIVALSTPEGRGGIAVIRLSGQPLPIARRIFTAKNIDFDNLLPNYMYFGKISGEGFRDNGYMVYFKSPKSYTGEDVVEFQVHGGMKIVEGIITECVNNGARPAERGEFTKRAFLNGKMDLSDAEGVIDMINADSEEAVRAAYRMMTGKLAAEIKNIQREITALTAELEVALDYPDEVDDQLSPVGISDFDNIISKLDALMRQRHYGSMVKNGIEVLIAGDTNVGKSSLMNAMLGAPRAIVSDTKGTTRDLVSESMEYKGKKIRLTDSAGVRESGDNIEKEGVDRAISAVKSADLVIRVLDASDINAPGNKPLDQALDGKKVITVYNKKDLAKVIADEDAMYISAKTGEGVTKLLDRIAAVFESEKMPEGEVITSQRHFYAVKKAREDMLAAKKAYGSTTVDCVIISLNASWSHLGEITGVTLPEDILNFIFDKFCVGK